MGTAIFNIEGGIGKHVAATAVISAYKNTYPEKKIVVVCAWPEVFLGNEDVERVYRLGVVPYFYRDFIYNKKDVEIFAHDPYRETFHVTKKKHLIDTWCNLVGVKRSKGKLNLNFNIRERDAIDPELAKIKKAKPLLVFQPFGGPGKNHQPHPYSWVRDIHPTIAQNIVNALHEKYIILHVCYDFHPNLQNVVRFEKTVAKKELFNLLRYSDKRLLIDSSLQHAAAAMELPSTVVWVGTSPKIFGYDQHRNITPPKEYPKGHVDSYIFDYNFTGVMHECPYNDIGNLHNVEEILKDF
jgi:hypothetical protein|tara:strand:+ start:247 stop:1137 length:891 start_codon:yes stop_codon:yes gene_type:complete